MFSTILFLAFAVVAVASALLMITMKNPLISALFLVFCFASIAGIYFMLNAQLIAIFQIIVYAGAIMVLIVFVIMLLNLSHLPGLSFRIIFTKLTGVILALVMIWTIFTVISPAIPELGSEDNLELMSRQDFPLEEGAPASVGENSIKKFSWALFNKWVYPFEIVSLILLVGVVGAVFFSKREIE